MESLYRGFDMITANRYVQNSEDSIGVYTKRSVSQVNSLLKLSTISSDDRFNAKLGTVNLCLNSKNIY